jgi:hypothetical protein
LKRIQTITKEIIMSVRKKWATSFPAVPGDKRKRHASEPAVYRYILDQAGEWYGGRLFSPMITIWVDEGDGAGWSTFEHVNLKEVAHEPPPDYDTEGDHPECPPHPLMAQR